MFVLEWRNVIKLGAIDCANDDNNPVCRDYNIMGYPTFKFFSANSPISSLGIELVKGPTPESDMTREIVGILQKEQLEGRGAHWPNITPYRSNDVNNLWREFESHETVNYVFLIFVEDVDPLATQVILDLSTMQGVEIRSVLSENEILARLMGVHTFPSLVLIEHLKTESEHLHPEENTRESFRRTIKSYLEAKGFIVPQEPKLVEIIQPKEVPSFAELAKAQETEKHIKKMKKMGDVVFLVDLENALRYSLEHEISSRKVISGEALVALNDYLAVLAKYFPVGEAGISFLQNLRDLVFVEREIRGLKFKSHLSSSSGGLEAGLATREEWIGCRGSESHYRGYPCGLWTLFHYMTVSAMRDSEHVHFDPLEVLNAVLGYITFFFGCTQCSKHFQEMANRSMRAKVTNAQQAVLWLWSAHNEVNERLAKEGEQDPEFPKIQFPSPEGCGKCRDSNERWDEQNVLIYLTSIYHQDSLNYLGSNTKLYSPNESDVLGKTLDKFDRLDELQMAHDSSRKLSKDFNIFDISLCVLLYAISALICVGVCLKFILKKRYRKKAYVHDLLGKV